MRLFLLTFLHQPHKDTREKTLSLFVVETTFREKLLSNAVRFMRIYQIIPLLFVMLSSVARAFTTPLVRQSLQSNSRFGSAQLFSTIDAQQSSLVEVCRLKIKDALSAENVVVTGAHDDPNGSHITIEVVSFKFSGKRAVQRQQMVYKAIWEEMQGPVHAVDSMTCKTPDEV